MKQHLTSHPPPGTALAETIISVGLLALAVPVVMSALGESGKSSLHSAAESYSGTMISLSLAELRASRRGHSSEFPATSIGQKIPPQGEIWVLGFSSSGCLLGRVSMDHYQGGVPSRHADPAVAYLVRCTASPPLSHETSGLLETRLTLEYPATTPAANRHTLDFFTLLP